MKRGLVAVAVYAAIYAAGLAVLAGDPGFSAGESLGVMLIFGLGLSLVAWWLTRGAAPPATPVRSPGRDVAWLAVLLVAIGVGFLGYGLSAVRAAVPREPAQSLAILGAKLVVFVLVPALLFQALGAPARTTLGFRRTSPGDLRALLILMALVTLLQLGLGRGPQAIRALMAERRLAAWQIALAALPVWAWMSLEAGLVEEYFFRALLQTRLAAWLRSETAGIVAMALLFGLAHAPGYVLRGAHVAEGMSRAPTPLTAAAYAIVVVSPLGLMFGVLWARTRNLALVVLLHGFGDLVPNLAPLLQAFLPPR